MIVNYEVTYPNGSIMHACNEYIYKCNNSGKVITITTLAYFKGDLPSLIKKVDNIRESILPIDSLMHLLCAYDLAVQDGRMTKLKS